MIKGKSTFTENEAGQIKEALKQYRVAGREAQIDIRENELRSRLKFYITDFTLSRRVFTPEDFDALVNDGKIKIEG
jgi:hypothetical protein